MTVLLGSNFYNGDADAMRRQQTAIEAATALAGATAINLQWAGDICERKEMETVPVLRHDSRSVLGLPVRRKPIMRELFDALAAAAAARGARYFAFYNADIVVSQAAVDAIARGGHSAYAMSRLDVEAGSQRALGVMPDGIDLFAFDVAWWLAERWRFRDYILGEWFYDPVFAALMLRYGNGLILNRRGEIRHEVHGHQPPAGPAARYNGYLAALDAPYFSFWVGYRARLDELRARGGGEAGEDDELRLQRDAFSRSISPGESIYHAARCVKAFVRYRMSEAGPATAG